MNLFSKIALRFFAKRRLRGESFAELFEATEILKEFGKTDDIHSLLPLLEKEDTIIRNNAVQSIKAILMRSENKNEFFSKFTELFNNAELIQKLSIIELIGIYPLEKKEKILVPLIGQTSNDLTFAIINAVKGSNKISVLEKIINVPVKNDPILKRVLYSAWFTGIKHLPDKDRIEYATNNLHKLIRATYEISSPGNLLEQMLSKANIKELPEVKAYPEIIFRYIIEMINKWDYNPKIYEVLHSIAVPAYFNFKKDGSEEQLFVKI